MKKILAGFTLATLILGGSVGFAASQIDVTMKEAKADYSNISLATSNNSFAGPDTAADDHKFTYVGQTDGWHYYNCASVSLTQGETFKIRDWETGHESAWMNYYNGTFVKQGLEKIESGDYNLVCRLTGQYSITYRWKDIDHKEIVGFNLLNAVDTYFVCDNSTWAESGKIYMHAWGDQGDLTSGAQSCPIAPIEEVTLGSDGFRFYRIQVPSNANGFILKAYGNNTDYKTGDLYNKGLCYTANNTLGYGSAGQIVGKIYSNLGSASYKGNAYDKSICATSYDNAQEIISLYNGTDANAKSVLAASTLNTYDVKNGGNYNAPIQDIISSLGLIAPQGSTRIETAVPSNSNNMALVITIASVSTIMLSGSAMFILRKKKEK